MTTSEGRKSEVEVQRRNLLVTVTEIAGDQRVHLQKVRDIGMLCFEVLHISAYLS